MFGSRKRRRQIATAAAVEGLKAFTTQHPEDLERYELSKDVVRFPNFSAAEAVVRDVERGVPARELVAALLLAAGERPSYEEAKIQAGVQFYTLLAAYEILGRQQQAAQAESAWREFLDSPSALFN
ncbi:MAG: hypothetical protein HKN91_08080 [Acidimicrobiia bacterium]|nr:hypothetical protein [Acidimicrobiia bacterium]